PLNNEESSNWFSRPMPLVHYLMYLLTYKVYREVISKMSEDNIKKRHILEALKHGTAFVCKQNQQGTDLIIPLVLDIGIHDPITLDNISYVLVSVKNYQKSTDTNYSNNATSMNLPSNVRTEQLSTLLFLSLYMQFGANMSGVDEEYHFPQKRKWESNVKDNEVNNSDEHTYRHCYQFAVRLFGLTAYDFLQENDSGNQLLNT
ncbi:4240_t:CDS:2, partial [Paraglomus brasilianum]